jgi:hypothetical protein
MTILFLCLEEDLWHRLASYAQAFRRRGIRVVCLERGFSFNGDLQDCLKLCPERPSLILQPEAGSPYLPWGLTEIDVPTASLQIDTYAYTRRRIAWSMLFDHVFVFHPGYDVEFQKAGHPGAHFISHAVDTELFAGKELERTFEVGWVGQVKGPIYRRREMVLPALSESFRMNDVERRHSLEEMARVYRQSKIVLNIGRDDFPQDANLRTFEVMGAGALLITSLPSELTQIGFEEGVHFIGYRKAEEIQPLIRKYLGENSERQRIANAARDKVLREHTYDQRVETLLQQIEACGKKLLAPARAWAEEHVRLAYLDYFAANGELKCAAKEFQRIARLSLKETALGGSLMARAYARMVRSRLATRRTSSDARGATRVT